MLLIVNLLGGFHGLGAKSDRRLNFALLNEPSLICFQASFDQIIFDLLSVILGSKI